MTYLNVSEIEAALKKLSQHYSEVTELIDLPYSTHEDRSCNALRIGTDNLNIKPGVLILGGVHAREWVPPDALISLAADLLEAYSKNKSLRYGRKTFSTEEIKTVLEHLNLIIFPCVNPDGRYYSQNVDSFWRKNRRLNTHHDNCYGVDINRNFDFLWDHSEKFSNLAEVSTSSNPCDHNLYRGPSAESEPETKNVVELLNTYTNIQWHLDIHSHVPVILYSWGSDDNQISNNDQNFMNQDYDDIRGVVNDRSYGEFIKQDDLIQVKAIATKMSRAIRDVRGKKYPVKQAVGLYPTSGASDDYAFSRHFVDDSKSKVFGFTVECGDSFQPEWNEAEEIIREVSAGIIEFSLQTLNI